MNLELVAHASLKIENTSGKVLITDPWYKSPAFWGSWFLCPEPNVSEDIYKTNSQIDSNDLMKNAKIFFKRNGLLLNWKEFEKLDSAQKINTLAMIAPITNEEKQKLLETVSLENKVNTLDNIISFYLYETNFNNQTVQ